MPLRSGYSDERSVTAAKTSRIVGKKIISSSRSQTVSAISWENVPFGPNTAIVRISFLLCHRNYELIRIRGCLREIR